MFSHDDGHVPPDVADITALLDALGSEDRASMDGRGLQHITVAAATACLHADIAVALTLDSAHPPVGLEQRVFEASRAGLAATNGLRLTGTGALPARRVGDRWWNPSLARIAAAIVVAGAGVVVIVAMRAAQIVPEQDGSSMLAASLTTEMEVLFDLLDSAPGAGVPDTAAASDHSVTEDLLEWESL